jgi:hypothetical protein
VDLLGSTRAVMSLTTRHTLSHRSCVR